MYYPTNHRFVLLSDITKHMETINPVIYNPKIGTISDRKRTLSEMAKKYLDLDLTDEQLVSLTKCDYQHLDVFMINLRKIYYEHKNRL